MTQIWHCKRFIHSFAHAMVVHVSAVHIDTLPLECAVLLQHHEAAVLNSVEHFGSCLQRARESLPWLASQEAKLADFCRDDTARALTLASLSKPQADLLTDVASHYGLSARPMQPLRNKQRLQLLKGPSPAAAAPQLATHARVLTEEDVARLQAKEAAEAHVLEWAPICCLQPLVVWSQMANHGTLCHVMR